MKNPKLLFFIGMFLISQVTSAQSWLVGDPSDVNSTPQGGIVLAGGASDNDDAMTWFVNRVDGGDVVVIRATGTDGYNSYIYGLGNVNSVETIIIDSRNDANNTSIETSIRNAEGLFIAGGDQADYVSFWEGTLVEDAINYLINTKNAVIGGTSAGCAIQGKTYFSAINGTVTSDETLSNPYHNRVTIGHNDFLNHAVLTHVITDTHYDNPDRKGRHTTFLARMVKDWGIAAKGIGVDEYTAVCVDENGIARVFGDSNYDDYAYFLQSYGGSPETCISGTPLTWDRSGEAVKVYKIKGDNTGSKSFNLNNWYTGNGGTWEDFYVTNGNLQITSPSSAPVFGNLPPIANANGPYSAFINETINFSSAGSSDPDGSISSYSWNFGDGATSSQINPSHSYNAAGSYNVSLTVTDNDGATHINQTTAEITDNSGGGNDVLVDTDFESGWGPWTDGGRDCSLYNRGTYAYEGSKAGNIQDNSGLSSAFWLTNGIDVHNPEYNEIEIDFYFYAVSMESGESFFIEYYNGSQWNTITRFTQGYEFNNNSFYHMTVTVSESDYNFPTDMKVSFECDASGNGDDIYIDNIVITGRNNAGKSVVYIQKIQDLKNKTIEPNRIENENELKLYPNPTSDIVNVVFDSAENSIIQLFDSKGKQIQQTKLYNSNYALNVSHLPKGIYFVVVTNNQCIQSKKLVKQ